MQATNGSFYGTTVFGGTGTTGKSCSVSGCGTVFDLATGLGAFAEAVPTSGKIGTKVTILGNDLTGSTAVSFHGTSATFRVVSPTEITTTVPTGATGGKIEVTTPGGVISTAVVFHIP